MSDPKRYSSQVWDRLFKMLYACDETMSDAEIEADLQRAKIDVRPTLRSVHHRIEQFKAREQFAKAKDARLSFIEKIRGVVAPPVEDLRAGIKQLIDRAFTGTAQVAHYQKLEKAATDEDLKSLLEDLTRLSVLREHQDENESEAK